MKTTIRLLQKAGLLLLFVPAILVAQADFHYPELENAFEAYRFCTLPLNTLKIQHVDSLLQALKQKFPESLQVEEVGRSVQNRPVFLASLGNGPVTVLLWSQMHGDEPTATAALFDIFHYLLNNPDDPFAQTILNNLTIRAIPMLNPDGAEKFQRCNAQNLDINRDARDRSSAEARILFQLKEKYHPAFGYNLHDQGQRRTVGNTNQLVAIALMAPPFDAHIDDNPVRIRAKKLVSVIYQALGPYLYGHIAKYDSDYIPRAFGDSMQNWGISTVLIESGGWYQDRDNFLQKMNFIAILASLHAIADGGYESANPAIYDALMLNDKDLYDLVINDVALIDGTGNEPFKTDVAINYHLKDTQNPHSERIGVIAEYGDLDYFAAKDTIAGAGYFLTPGLIGVADYFSGEDRFTRQVSKMAQSGYTTILISLNEKQVNILPSIQKTLRQIHFPGNSGALLTLETELVSTSDSLHLLRTLKRGFMGLALPDSTIKTATLSTWLGLPNGYLDLADAGKPVHKLSGSELLHRTGEPAEKWQIPRRGNIRPGQIADLVLFSKKIIGKPKVELIMVKGHRVYENGEWIKSDISGDCWLPE